MANYVKMSKPGTHKTQLVEADKVDFYRQYGWETAVTEVTAVLRPPKKSVKPKPTVEEQSSVEEVGTEDIKGE
jgi:hypothetical protein